MCFGFGGGGTTATSKMNNPDAVAAGHLALARVKGINNTPYQAYGGQRVAGFDPDQTNAFNQVRSLSSAPSVLNERLVDEGGRLGKISDYIDPYVAQTLQPAIRNIQEAGQQQRMDIGDQAQSAHAFGDARHGIVEGMQMRDESRNIGDLSAQKYSDAYNTAMAERGADRTSLATGEQDRMQRALALLGVGDRGQAQQQKGLDTQFEEFQRKGEDPYRKLDAILSFLTGNPASRDVTTTTSNNNNNWLAQLLGGAAGAFI